MCATSNHSSSNITEIEAFEVHHWPIVRGYADRIGLVKVINDLVPTQMDVEPGTIVLGMVLDTLSGRSPLYHLQRFFEDQDTALLLGKTVAPGYFNDDNVARVLDLIYEKGTNLLFAEVAMAAVKAFNVPINHLHFDTTSVTLHGDYQRFDDAQAKGPHVTFGYSKDKRPDLKQFVQTLLCAGGGIPLLGKPENGNASDKTLNNDLLSKLSAKMAKFGLDPGAYLYIADSAMVSEDNLKTIGDDTPFITRLPATLYINRRAF